MNDSCGPRSRDSIGPSPRVLITEDLVTAYVRAVCALCALVVHGP